MGLRLAATARAQIIPRSVRVVDVPASVMAAPAAGLGGARFGGP